MSETISDAEIQRQFKEQARKLYLDAVRICEDYRHYNLLIRQIASGAIETASKDPADWSDDMAAILDYSLRTESQEPEATCEIEALINKHREEYENGDGILGHQYCEMADHAWKVFRELSAERIRREAAERRLDAYNTSGRKDADAMADAYLTERAAREQAERERDKAKQQCAAFDGDDIGSPCEALKEMERKRDEARAECERLREELIQVGHLAALLGEAKHE